MLLVLLFFAELFFLFLLSRELTRSLSYLFYKLTRNATATIYLLAILFLPGTFVHELAHYFMAVVLFVHAEGLELIPKLHEHGVKLGSVQIAHTDPFRRLFIGMAPFLFGTVIIFGLLYAAVSQQMLSHVWFIILLGYVVFEIGNTMFSSRKDMEGALELLIGVFIVLLFLYFLGFRASSLHIDTFFAHPLVQSLFQKGCLFLSFPLLLDIVVVGLLHFVRKK